jgi:pimeloyl-ACP methyl ester carboxylesterase
MKGWVGAGIGLAVLILGVTGFEMLRNPEHEAIDADARRSAPGKFVRLTDGVTHYDVSGPDSGRAIVLVHGFSVPYYIWDSTAKALAASGHRVIRYDEYGRGWSDRPAIVYNAELYERQLRDLLDSLHVQRVDVAGVSMGGWVTATFVSRHPERVRTLTLVDPVTGTATKPGGLFALPLVGDYLWQTLAVPHMAEGQTADLLRPERFPRWVARYRTQMRFRGFGHALLSTRRNIAGTSMDSVYRAVAATGVPTLLLWGIADRTVPFETNGSVRHAIPSAEFHAIEGAAHLPIIEQAQHTDSLIIAFLAKHP